MNIFSIKNDVIYSIDAHTKIDFKNILKISLSPVPINKTNKTILYPYIGHIGPSKNPRLTNFFSSINLQLTSKNHPINEYIKK